MSFNSVTVFRGGCVFSFTPEHVYVFALVTHSKQRTHFCLAKHHEKQTHTGRLQCSGRLNTQHCGILMPYAVYYVYVLAARKESSKAVLVLVQYHIASLLTAVLCSTCAYTHCLSLWVSIWMHGMLFWLPKQLPRENYVSQLAPQRGAMIQTAVIPL